MNATPPRRNGRRGLVGLCIALLLALSIAATVANVAAPFLLRAHPLILITASPRPRHLILAAGDVNVVSFFLLAFIRLVVSDPLAFWLGIELGDPALEWGRKKGRVGGWMEAGIRRLFRRYGKIIVFLVPDVLVAFLAGSSGMRLHVFLPLVAAGTVIRLSAFWLVSVIFATELRSVIVEIDKYRWPISGALLTFLIFTAARRIPGERRRHRDRPGEIETEPE